MAKINASIPQGTRDFGPETVHKRNYILSTIRTAFELYGFQPLETPAMENLETLMGRYGDEGDKLIFKILNNGLSDPKNTAAARAAFENVMTGRNDTALTSRALRYDLTIPFARYVAMHYGQLTIPFKRYQVQPVWRADRPQKGRYREFYQCDADTVGSYSLFNEAELALVYITVFEKLGIGVELKINSRKILTALAEICGGADKLTAITIAIDKLDKIGLEKVKEELFEKKLTADQVSIIEQYLAIGGSNENKLQQIRALVGNTESGKKGIAEIEFVLGFPSLITQDSALAIDFTLARGLDYYTGIIFEAKAKEVQIGSIGGGGRYDDLTGSFGVANLPGVGISFGVDRIYDVMEELNLFPAALQTGTQVLFFNLGDAESKNAFALVQQLRNRGIRSELYPDTAKFDKQFRYAEKKNIAYAVIIGSKELLAGNCTVKYLPGGQQEAVPQNDLATYILSKL